MAVFVRVAKPEDLHPLTDLMHQYSVDFYKRPRPSIEKVHLLIQTLLQNKGGIQFVSEQEGVLLGFATLYFSFSTTKPDKITIMNDLFVVEQARGTGVAEQLFKTCENFSKANGYAYMSWVTASDNKRAQRFYEKMGGIAGDWINYSI